jgi:hypothetical protein
MHLYLTRQNPFQQEAGLKYCLALNKQSYALTKRQNKFQVDCLVTMLVLVDLVKQQNDGIKF